MRVLVVEDEHSLRRLLKYDLESQGHEVLVVEDGMSAVEIVKKEEVELILLDLMLPKMDGIEVCHEIRKFNTEVYIILLTAIDEEISKLEAFKAGADDYVTKPFSMREIFARMKAASKRFVVKSKALTYQHLTIDLEKHLVFCDDSEVNITFKEFELITYLILNEGKALEREKILERIWGYDYLGETRVVDIYIHKIRDKLQLESYIKTVRGVGYMLRSLK